jgi:hypothetical protein
MPRTPFETRVGPFQGLTYEPIGNGYFICTRCHGALVRMLHHPSAPELVPTNASTCNKSDGPHVLFDVRRGNIAHVAACFVPPRPRPKPPRKKKEAKT